MPVASTVSPRGGDDASPEMAPDPAPGWQSPTKESEGPASGDGGCASPPASTPPASPSGCVDASAPPGDTLPLVPDPQARAVTARAPGRSGRLDPVVRDMLEGRKSSLESRGCERLKGRRSVVACPDLQPWRAGVTASSRH